MEANQTIADTLFEIKYATCEYCCKYREQITLLKDRETYCEKCPLQYFGEFKEEEK